MRYFKSVCITIISVGFLIPSLAQQKNFTAINTRVDSFINLQMTQKNIVGLSLAVMHEGKIIHTKGYGFANLEHKVPAVHPCHKHLMKPEGRIHFAGAYADNLNWGTEAATRSANRVANEIDKA